MSFLSAHSPGTDFPADPRVLDQLLAPAQQLLEAGCVRHVYRDGPLNDARFLHLGVTRVLSQSVSGRDFLQYNREVHGDVLARSSFFDSLHSSGRRDRLAQLNTELTLRQRAGLPDLLQDYPELSARALYGVDGHHLAHAVHARRDAEGDFVSCNSLYVLCLHSSLLLNLGAVQGEGVRRHEMPVFRQRIVPWLAQHGPGRGAPPIFVVDPAFVDKQFWTRMAVLEQRQALMITRTKANMKPVVYGSRVWDPQAPVNQGVSADESVGLDNSVILRRIGYRDPETGVEYELLTTVPDLAPGLIALLYLLRWRIEKVFDTGKNKLQETKAWATGEVAQEIQAHFFALTHNLLVMLRAQLDQRETIRELKVEKKREASLSARRAKAAAHGRAVPEHQKRLPAVVQLHRSVYSDLTQRYSRQNALAGRPGALTTVHGILSIDYHGHRSEMYSGEHEGRVPPVRENCNSDLVLHWCQLPPELADQGYLPRGPDGGLAARYEDPFHPGHTYKFAAPGPKILNNTPGGNHRLWVPDDFPVNASTNGAWHLTNATAPVKWAVWSLGSRPNSEKSQSARGPLPQSTWYRRVGDSGVIARWAIRDGTQFSTP